jgi:hypothetical protein
MLKVEAILIAIVVVFAIKPKLNYILRYFMPLSGLVNA